MSLNASHLVVTDVTNPKVDLDPIKDSFHISIVISVLYCVIIVLGIIGNSLVICVAGFKIKILKQKSPPSTSNRSKSELTKVCVVNLAIADLIFCLTRISSLIKILFFFDWPFGIFVCKFNGFFKYANMFCSVFLLGVISLERALLVWKPHCRRGLFEARAVAVAVWILAIGFSAPSFIYREVYLDANNHTQCSLDGSIQLNSSVKSAIYAIRFSCGFLLPFLVIIICNIYVAVQIKRRAWEEKSLILKNIVLFVAAFFVCWAPYHCLLLVRMVKSKNSVVKALEPVASGLAYFHSCVNPVLYYCLWVRRKKKCGQGESGTESDSRLRSISQQLENSKL